MKTKTLDINEQELNFATYWQAYPGKNKSFLFYLPKKNQEQTL